MSFDQYARTNASSALNALLIRFSETVQRELQEPLIALVNELSRAAADEAKTAARGNRVRRADNNPPAVIVPAREESEEHARAQHQPSSSSAIRLLASCRALDASSTESELHNNLVTALGHEYRRAALYSVVGDHVEGRCSVGFDAVQISGARIAMSVDCAITRAVATARTVQTGSATALPIAVEAGRVAAVAYAEEPAVSEEGEHASEGRSMI